MGMGLVKKKCVACSFLVYMDPTDSNVTQFYMEKELFQLVRILVMTVTLTASLAVTTVKSLN